MKRLVIFLSLVCIAIFTASCSEQVAPDLSEDDIDVASSGCNYVFLRNIKLKNDGFDKVYGVGTDPEIELISKAGSTYKRQDFARVNHKNVNYGTNYYIGYSCDNAIFYWNERDPDGIPITASYKGISLKTEIRNGDDLVGATQTRLLDMRFWPTRIDLNNIEFKVCAVPYLSRAKNEGQYSEAVKHLQRRLKFPESWVDGYFGPTTEKYVKAFQQKAFPNQPGEWDGKVGSQTWGALGC